MRRLRRHLGYALAELTRIRPDVRLINLVSAPGVPCCTLANNHVLDWGHRGLLETPEGRLVLEWE